MASRITSGDWKKRDGMPLDRRPAPQAHLRCIDPVRNMRRFYRLDVGLKARRPAGAARAPRRACW
jgi:hypothetical protein